MVIKIRYRNTVTVVISFVLDSSRDCHQNLVANFEKYAFSVQNRIYFYHIDSFRFLIFYHTSLLNHVRTNSMDVRATLSHELH